MFWKWLIFWKENIHTGWEIGDGIFGFIIEVSLIIGGGLLILKLFLKSFNWDEKWKGWEDHLMKIAFVIFAISFLIATFFIAPFLQYENVASPKISQALPVPPKKPLVQITIPNPAPTPPLMPSIPTQIPSDNVTQQELEPINDSAGETTNYGVFMTELKQSKVAQAEAQKRQNDLTLQNRWNVYRPYYSRVLTIFHDAMRDAAHAADHDEIAQSKNYGECLPIRPISETVGEVTLARIQFQKHTNVDFLIKLSSLETGGHRTLILFSPGCYLELEPDWGDTFHRTIHVDPDIDDTTNVPIAQADALISKSVDLLIGAREYTLGITNK